MIYTQATMWNIVLTGLLIVYYMCLLIVYYIYLDLSFVFGYAKFIIVWVTLGNEAIVVYM